MDKIIKAITSYIKPSVIELMKDTFEASDSAVTAKELDEICGKLIRKFLDIGEDNPTPDELLDIMAIDAMELNSCLEDIRNGRF